MAKKSKALAIIKGGGRKIATVRTAAILTGIGAVAGYLIGRKK